MTTQSAIEDVLVAEGVPLLTACRVSQRIIDIVVADVDLNDAPRLHTGASAAQRETVEALVQRGLSARRLRTLAAVRERAFTCDEIERQFNTSHQSQSATLNWLERQGLVERDYDVVRRTSNGGNANPYKITERGTALLKMMR